jgi:hypothetical protein
MSLVNKLRGIVNPTRIDDFKSTIGKHQGLARNNRFLIFMRPPAQSILNIDLENIAISALSGNFKAKSLVNDPRDIALLCDSTSLPGRQIQTMDAPHLGFRNTIKHPTQYFNEDIEFTFHLTNDYYMKKMFDKWMGLIINKETFMKNYDEVYMTDITIQQLNAENMPVYGVKLKNAFPITMGGIELNNSGTETSKLSITFTYEDFEPTGGISSTFGGIKDAIGL